MAEMGERVAVLETQMAAYEEKIDGMEAALKDMAAAQQQLLLELAKYRGGWGAVVMIGSAIITALGFAKDWLIGLIK